MGRKKLTDDERIQRKRDAFQRLKNSYRTYSDGPKGSPEQWKQAASLILSGNTKQSHLDALNLSSTPDTLEDLKRAWKKAMVKSHPDKGGTHEEAMKINEAYEFLKCKFGPTLVDQGDDIEPAKAEHIEHVDYANLWKDLNYINENYIAEKKLDGSRYILYLGETCRLLSRRISDVTGKYVDKTLNCPHLTRANIPEEFWGTVLDGEMVHPHSEKSDSTTSIMGCSASEAVERQQKHGWLQFVVYDAPKIQKEDLRKSPLKDRKPKLKKLIDLLKTFIPVTLHPNVPATEAKDLYEKTVASGGEGIMLKDLNAPYGKGWLKVKKVVTWDVVIMGYTEPKKSSKKANGTVSATYYHQQGLIGAIRFGAYKNGKLVELGTCSGMTESIRRDISNNKESYIGKVIEIKFQERTKSGAFRHARFIKIREDKAATQCVDK